MAREKKDGSYEDIIHLPHHSSKTHPRMSMLERAAQFSPFAALTGYSGVIREAGRLTEQKIELGESEIEELERSLNWLAKNAGQHPSATITYFQPDEKKEGGAYVTVTEQIKRLDETERVIWLIDGTRISIENILRIEELE